MQMLDVASELLMTYGYWAVLLLVAVESMGLPVPGETMVLSAAIYAGATHQLDIALVVVAAAAGAILGDNLGYLLGREGGYRLLRRYGRCIRLDERRLKLVVCQDDSDRLRGSCDAGTQAAVSWRAQGTLSCAGRVTTG